MIRHDRRAVVMGGLGLALGACTSLEGARTAPTPSGEFEFVQRGDSGPSIVFLHGLGVGMETWAHVLDSVGMSARACAYNRPGYGKSRWHEHPRDIAHIAVESRDAALGAGLAPPVILVGHSLGGLYAQGIAQLAPEHVAGLVLVDSTTVGQWEMLKHYMPVQAALIRASTLRMGAAARREFLDSVDVERAVAAGAPYRRGPVVVLRSAHLEVTASRDYVAARRQSLGDLAQAMNAEIVDAPTGHFIQNERPDLVVDAVLRVIRG